MSAAQLLQAARNAANAIAYAMFNLAEAKLEDLPEGMTDSTDAVETALIAERELREAVAAFRPQSAPANAWLPFSSVPRDGTPVDLWCEERQARVLNVRFLRAEEVDYRFAKGECWAHLATDGFRTGTQDTAVLVEEGFTHWRRVENDRPPVTQ